MAHGIHATGISLGAQGVFRGLFSLYFWRFFL